MIKLSLNSIISQILLLYKSFIELLLLLFCVYI